MAQGFGELYKERCCRQTSSLPRTQYLKGSLPSKDGDQPADLLSQLIFYPNWKYFSPFWYWEIRIQDMIWFDKQHQLAPLSMELHTALVTFLNLTIKGKLNITIEPAFFFMKIWLDLIIGFNPDVCSRCYLLFIYFIFNYNWHSLLFCISSWCTV